MICSIYGNDAVTECIGQKCLLKSILEININEAPRSCRPTERDSSYDKEIIDTTPPQTVPQIATVLIISHKSVVNQLRFFEW